MSPHPTLNTYDTFEIIGDVCLVLRGGGCGWEGYVRTLTIPDEDHFRLMKGTCSLPGYGSELYVFERASSGGKPPPPGLWLRVGGINPRTSRRDALEKSQALESALVYSLLIPHLLKSNPVTSTRGQMPLVVA